MTTRRNFLAAATVIGVASSSPITLLSNGSSVISELPSDMVSKFVSKSHGDIETVKSLLKKSPGLVRAAWDWGNEDFETGLNAASHVGRREVAELLLENGAHLDLSAAVMLGLTGVVKETLKVFTKMHAVPGAHGIPLLSHAIVGKTNANDVFELLIEAGADVNSKSTWSVTPLMVAAGEGSLSQVELLLEKGADPNVKNNKGLTAFELATKSGKKKCAMAIQSALGKQ